MRLLSGFQALTNFSLALEHHGDWVFNVISEGLEPLSPHGTIHYSVITAESSAHHAGLLKLPCWCHHNALGGAADSKDGSLHLPEHGQ